MMLLFTIAVSVSIIQRNVVLGIGM